MPFHLIYGIYFLIKDFHTFNERNISKAIRCEKCILVLIQKSLLQLDDIRLHLIRALGRFTGSKFVKKSEVLVIYMIQEEFSIIFAKKGSELAPPNPDVFVILAILDLLNNNVISH
jgi:hypothetical protein